MSEIRREYCTLKVTNPIENIIGDISQMCGFDWAIFFHGTAEKTIIQQAAAGLWNRLEN